MNQQPQKPTVTPEEIVATEMGTSIAKLMVTNARLRVENAALREANAGLAEKIQVAAKPVDAVTPPAAGPVAPIERAKRGRPTQKLATGTFGASPISTTVQP